MLRKLIAILLTLFLLPIIIFGILLIYFEDGSPGIFKQKDWVFWKSILHLQNKNYEK